MAENTGGKEEIAQCFQKTCAADTLKQGLVFERVKLLRHTMTTSNDLEKEPF